MIAPLEDGADAAEWRSLGGKEGQLRYPRAGTPPLTLHTVENVHDVQGDKLWPCTSRLQDGLSVAEGTALLWGPNCALDENIMFNWQGLHTPQASVPVSVSRRGFPMMGTPLAVTPILPSKARSETLPGMGSAHH
jgi:hypothetical protein